MARMTLEDEFCDVVSKARMGRGQSIAQAADAAHLQHDEWECLERGTRFPSEREVYAVARALDLKGEALAAVAVRGWLPACSPEWVSSLVVTVRGAIGGYEVKGYVLYDSHTRQAICIDTAYNATAMLAAIEADNLTLVGVCLTHGHRDHAGGLERIVSEWRVPVYLGPGDGPLVPWMPSVESVIVPDDQHIIAVGDLAVQCVATPGHTPGGFCYTVHSRGRSVCFVGDTLFAGSVGRSNPFSLYADHLRSVRRQVLRLDPATVLLPGHGPPTTVNEEREYNPFG